MPKYWIVGAMWGGEEDVLPTFITRGYWYCWDVKEDGPEPSPGNSVGAQRERFRQIERDDRIAVKKLLGRGASEMEIRALGIVKDIDPDEWRVYVDWLPVEVKRKVPLAGCVAAVHGPYEASDPWIHQVFHI